MSNFELFQEANKAIVTLAQRIVNVHNPELYKTTYPVGEWALNEQHTTLELLLSYLDGQDGVGEGDEWIADVLKKIEDKTCIFHEIECPECEKVTKVRVNTWQGGKPVAGECRGCRSQLTFG